MKKFYLNLFDEKINNIYMLQKFKNKNTNPFINFHSDKED